MAEDEDGRVAGGGGQVRLDEGGDVGEHARRRAREAAVGGGGDAAAPAALVEAVDGDAARGEEAEEGVVAVDVIAVAVDEDEFGLGGAVIGLDGGGGGLVVVHRGRDEACNRTTYQP